MLAVYRGGGGLRKKVKGGGQGRKEGREIGWGTLDPSKVRTMAFDSGNACAAGELRRGQWRSSDQIQSDLATDNDDDDRC